MKFGRVFAIGLSVSLLASLPAMSAVKAGSACKKVGKTSVVKGKTYTCIKSGKKKVWSKGAPVETASPVETPSPIPSNTELPKPNQPQDDKYQDNYLSKSSTLDTCRLQETKNISGAGPKGFPMRSKVPHLGEVKIAIIPVDFENAQGVGNPDEMYRDDIQTMIEWSKFFSGGNMVYKPELASKSWLRAPKGAEWYVCVECQKGATEYKQPMQVAFRELIEIADKNYDFTDTKFVYFAFPLSAEAKFGTSMYFHRVNLQSNEGEFTVSVYGEMGGQTDNYGRDRSHIWNHVIHEILHFQGFIGHGPYFGQGIMSDEFGPSQAITSWEGFLASWFGEGQIICLEKNVLGDSVYVTMDSLDTLGSKPISTMIRINEEELLIIERRSDGKYSDFSKAFNWREMFLNLDNFTAYKVNVNEIYERADWRDLDSLKPNFWKYIRENNAIRIKGSISYAGIKVEVVNKEQVRISLSN